VEEALKVIDNVSSRHPKSTGTLVGINDQEFNLIEKSLTSPKSLRGRFMSPVISLCNSSDIPFTCVGRKITATSSRLSCVFMRHPLEFYKLLWIITSKSLSVLRTPQARSFIEHRVPNFAKAYFDEGSETMAIKILQSVNELRYDKTVAIVPLENYHAIINFLELWKVESANPLDLQRKLQFLEEDTVGLWAPVLIMYVLAPILMIGTIAKKLKDAYFGESSNFETEGVSIVGSWVRDKRRD